MKRFRNWRRRSAALALLPATALIAMSATETASGAPGFETSQKRVKPNESVTLSGRFAAPQTASTEAGGKGDSKSDAAVQGVRLQFRANGAEHWQDAERTETGRSGKFSERVKVKRSGRFRAVSADGRATPSELVRVKSVTRARIGDDTVKQGDKVAIKGHVAPAGTSRKVAVKVGGETLHTRTSKGGGFKVKWKAEETGESTVRVRAAADRIAAGSGDKAGKVAVLRPAIASYYGPGLYGNPVACGGTLQPDTVGVAHKSLPCGTKLVVAYGNKSVKTEVIDRGPYVGNREFDLTEALKNKIGFGSTGTVYVSK